MQVQSICLTPGMSYSHTERTNFLSANSPELGDGDVLAQS